MCKIRSASACTLADVRRSAIRHVLMFLKQTRMPSFVCVCVNWLNSTADMALHVYMRHSSVKVWSLIIKRIYREDKVS